MFRFISIIPAVLMIPAGFYLYFYFKRMAAFFHTDVKKRLVKALLIILSVVVAAQAMNIWGLGAVVVLYGIALAVVMDVVNFIISRVHKGRQNRMLSKTEMFDGPEVPDSAEQSGSVDLCGKGEMSGRVRMSGRTERSGSAYTVWKKVYRCGLMPLVCLALLMGYGYWNMAHVKQTHYTVSTEKNVRSEGYRIALITDLHFGTTMDANKLDAHCREIEAQQPDVIVLCGDIVDEATSLSQMQEAARILGGMTSEYGIFYVFGNHDRAWYSRNPAFTAQELEETLTSAGIHVLCDESYAVNDELTLIGREDRSFFGGNGRKNQEELLDGVDKDDFLLLLDHQPSELMENAAAGFDLQLSGHTHGGQIWPVGVVSDILGFGELNYGYEQMDDFQVIVSSGIAGWGYAVRTGSHSEYVIVDVGRKS